ncbi:MAG TPA: ECF-type sigma factor [Gemmatimonadaceae bacterium]|nr:ECF-type sigma factor [Gemmatimonadaceae bacterium]
MAEIARTPPSPAVHGAPTAQMPDGVPSGRAIDALVPIVYPELRAIAHRHLRRQKAYDGSDATLATTGLVHEAYLKLAAASGAWCDRPHFLATAAMAMRQILVDRARAQSAAKRGGRRANVTLDDDALVVAGEPEALLEIDGALARLGETAPRLARIVEYRFYGGMTEDETAAVLGVTTRTVQRDWLKARMLLRRALTS